MHLAWLRLGQAEFHKGDFLGAVSTFNYIINHYQNDPDIIAQCRLWIARAYAEMGWQYEAEDALNRVQIDALSKKHAKLYSAVKADVLLKGEHYREALPFVKIACMPEMRRSITSVTELPNANRCLPNPTGIIFPISYPKRSM